MSVYLSLPAALLLAAGLASAAAAQPANPPVADPATPVPTLHYQSVFAPPPAAPAKTGWREANDRVRETGGHGGALKQGEGGPPAPSMPHRMQQHPMPMQHPHRGPRP